MNYNYLASLKAKPLHICLKKSCSACEIRASLTCRFSFLHFLGFYAMSAPVFVLGGISLYLYPVFFYSWFIIIGLFFLLLGTRVLCTHCPHYNNPDRYFKCQANYGLPKFWKRRPRPMSNMEKTVLITGHVIIWCYPVPFMLFIDSWMLLAGYIPAVLLFFILLRLFFCKKCVNFSCPLNAVKQDIRVKFFENSTGIRNFQ